MIKERAMELVAALRSGKYTQGVDLLRTKDNRFCCLGVACDIANPLGWTEGAVNMRHEDTYTTGLSPVAQEYFGFHSDMGMPRMGAVSIDGTNYGALSTANDAGVPFSDIADYIEAHWEDL